MKNFKFLPLVCSSLLVTFLAGCASTPEKAPEPYTYQSDKSRALNLVEAAGLQGYLRDSEIADDQISSQLSGVSTAEDIGYVASSFAASPVTGFTSLEFGGISLLNVMMSGSKKNWAKYSKFFGWMPEDLVVNGRSARQTVLDHIEPALLKTAEDMGFITEHGRYSHSIVDQLVLFVVNKDMGCLPEGATEVDNLCILNIASRDLSKKTVVPSFIHPESRLAYDVYAAGKGSVGFHWEGNNSGFSQALFMKKLSNNLPDWLYVYMSPDSHSIGNGNVLKMPVVLDNGKPLLFVKSK